MPTIQIYDRPLCCSTGVCGPQVDPVIARFASDLEWMRTQGVSVERFNLAQQPTAFVENPTVRSLLASSGVDCLPLIIVDGKIVSQGQYLSRERLAASAGIGHVTNPLFVISGADDCCKEPGCC